MRKTKLYEGRLGTETSDMLNKSSTTRPLGNPNAYCKSMYLFTNVKNLRTNNILYYRYIVGVKNETHN